MMPVDAGMTRDSVTEDGQWLSQDDDYVAGRGLGPGVGHLAKALTQAQARRITGAGGGISVRVTVTLTFTASSQARSGSLHVSARMRSLTRKRVSAAFKHSVAAEDSRSFTRRSKLRPRKRQHRQALS